MILPGQTGQTNFAQSATIIRGVVMRNCILSFNADGLMKVAMKIKVVKF